MDTPNTQQRILEVAASRGITPEVANVFGRIGQSKAFSLAAAYQAFGHIDSGLAIQIHEHSRTNHQGTRASVRV